MTQYDVSAALKRPYYWCNKIEHGRLTLNAVEFILYCRAIKAEPGDIMNETAARAKLHRRPLMGA